MPKTLGDSLPFGITVTDENGALANASTVTITIERPDGTAEPGSPFTISPTSTGIYDKTVTSAQVGLYTGYWLTTGPAGADESQVFYVRSSSAQWFVSLDDAKSHCNIPASTTTHDEELKWMLGAACGVVENVCGPVLTATQTEVVWGGFPEIALPHNQVTDLTTLTPVMVYGPAVTLTDLDVATDGIIRHTGGLPISAGWLRAVYETGRTEIPDALHGAALIIVKHLWETQRGPGPAGFQAGIGETIIPGVGFAVPNRAVDLMNLHPAPAGMA